jgi:rhamnosyltransferase
MFLKKDEIVSIIIPTYNGKEYIAKLIESLKSQTFRDTEIIVVDSSSPDGTINIAREYGVRTLSVKKEEFDHGGTRTLAGKASVGNIIVYLTQDALPADEYAIENIIGPFERDELIGAVYGRQLPNPAASPFAAHSRYFIYRDRSFIMNYGDRGKYRIKTAFLSNAFSAYRRCAMEKIGYFKENLISTEDTYAGAKLLLAGYSIAYASNAVVYHSHNYGAIQEFKRYFDIGSFHRIENWIVKEFGSAANEGLSYIKSELLYLIKTKNMHLLAIFLFRSVMKWLGYKLGWHHRLLPRCLINKFSMHREWWNNNFFRT